MGHGANAANEKGHFEALERREQCLQLRLAGMTYSQIGAQIGIDKSAVCRHVKQALEDLTEDVLDAAAKVRNVELARLERLQQSIWARALKGDDKAIDKMLKIMERRAKLLGIDAPTKIAGGGEGDSPINLKTVVEVAFVEPGKLDKPPEPA